MRNMALSTAVAIVLMTTSSHAVGSTGTVLLGSQDCGYVLLDREAEGFAMMRVTGADLFPAAGDMLRFDNPLPENDFVEVAHPASGSTFHVWVEQLIRDDTRAISRYHRRCG